MYDRHDLACILVEGVVVGVQNEVLVWRGGDVVAGEVPATALDHNDQSAALAGIFGLRVREDFSLEAITKHHWVNPAPAKDPNGSGDVAPKRSLHELNRLPQRSELSVPTDWSLASQ